MHLCRQGLWMGGPGLSSTQAWGASGKKAGNHWDKVMKQSNKFLYNLIYYIQEYIELVLEGNSNCVITVFLTFIFYYLQVFQIFHIFFTFWLLNQHFFQLFMVKYKEEIWILVFCYFWSTTAHNSGNANQFQPNFVRPQWVQICKQAFQS